MKNKTRGNVHKKEWLLRYIELTEEIEQEEEQYMYWRDKAVSLSTPSLDNMGIRSANTMGTPEYVIRFLDIAETCKEDAEKAKQARKEILDAINQLENVDERRLLKMHYINGYTMEYIAHRLHYSVDWIFKLHRRALNNLNISEKSTADA